MNLIRNILDVLPKTVKDELKRHYFRRQIKKHTFTSSEEEYYCLENWVEPGDWVLDVGANIGRYTLKFSELVGKTGRVISFEPIPDSFNLLAHYVALQPVQNITLMNVALSDSQQIIGVDIPEHKTVMFDTHTQANLTDNATKLQILCIPFDDLCFTKKIKFVKIDTEGHELKVLKGMKKLLKRDLPVLLVEEGVQGVIPFLESCGYTSKKFDNSRNRIFFPVVS
jgi:FkbM family methyltransferase